MIIYSNYFKDPFNEFVQNPKMYYLGVDSQQRFFVIEKKSWYICFLRALQPFLQLFHIDAFAKFRSRYVIQEIASLSMDQHGLDDLETFLKVLQCFQKKDQENDPTQKVLLNAWIYYIEQRIEETIREIQGTQAGNSAIDRFLETDFKYEEALLENSLECLTSLESFSTQPNPQEFRLPNQSVLLDYLQSTSLDYSTREIVAEYFDNRTYSHIYDFMIFLHDQMGLSSVQQERECFEALSEASIKNMPSNKT